MSNQTTNRKRPGRPRFADSVAPGPDDDMQSKRTRQRLAQRSYRSRKESALTTARARAAELESNLTKALQSFNQFQSFVAGRNGTPLPPDVLTQLTKTASELASIAQLPRLADDSEESASKEQSPELEIERLWKIPLSENAIVNLKWFEKLDRAVPSIAHRMLFACIDRAIKLFSLTGDSELGWHALGPLNPLKVLEAHRPGVIHRLNTIHMGGLMQGHWVDAKYEPRVLSNMPIMLRTIEGRGNVLIPRLAPPKLQSLEFGKTRTVLRIEAEELKGEWLEAMDVEEYLSERGICLRDGSQASDRIVLGLPSSEGGTSVGESVEEVTGENQFGQGDVLDWQTEATADVPDFTNFLYPNAAASSYGVSQGPFNSIPSGTRSFTPSAEQYSSLLNVQQSTGGFGSGSAFIPETTPYGVTTMGMMMIPSVTVNVDKLISMLAVDAVCLGSGPGVRRSAVDLAIKESLTIG